MQLAQRVLEPKSLATGDRIDLAYRLTLARPATTAEREEILKFLEQYQQALASAGTKGNQRLAAWSAFCQTLFAMGEFRYVY